jgi:hypothetical protein
MQLPLAFIAFSSCAVTSILKAALFVPVAVTPILELPVSVAIEFTFGPIPSFLSQTFLAATAALVAVAFLSFRTLLGASFSATAALVIVAILAFRALLGAPLSANTAFFTGAILAFRALLRAPLFASTAFFIGATLALGPLVRAPLRCVSPAHISARFLLGGRPAGSSRRFSLPLGAFAAPAMFGCLCRGVRLCWRCRLSWRLGLRRLCLGQSTAQYYGGYRAGSE